jgi:hypothetical protein
MRVDVAADGDLEPVREGAAHLGALLAGNGLEDRLLAFGNVPLEAEIEALAPLPALGDGAAAQLHRAEAAARARSQAASASASAPSPSTPPPTPKPDETRAEPNRRERSSVSGREADDRPPRSATRWKPLWPQPRSTASSQPGQVERRAVGPAADEGFDSGAVRFVGGADGQSGDGRSARSLQPLPLRRDDLVGAPPAMGLEDFQQLGPHR